MTHPEIASPDLIGVCAVVVCLGALRHVYKIVCRARILEKRIKVTQDWKLK